MRVKTPTLAVAAICLAWVSGGCGSGPSVQPLKDASKNGLLAPSADPWQVSAVDPNDGTPALLWNGLCGFRMNRNCTAVGQPFFSSDDYAATGEEKIRSLQSPLPGGFLLDGEPIPIRGGYRQILDLKASELTTRWSSEKGNVTCQIVLHPQKRILSERWVYDAPHPGHTLDFDLGPNGRLGKESMFSTDFTLGDANRRGKLLVTQKTGDSTTVEVTITLGAIDSTTTTSEKSGKAANTGLVEARPPSVEPFEQVEKETADIWSRRWKTDIEIEGAIGDQQAVRSWMYYLQSSLSAEGKMAVSPFGLSNQMYNGHVFWDADIWVFPALELLAPDSAKAISSYRLRMLKSARQNAAEAHKLGCKYPWESSVSGKETVVGPSSKEIHITGDVAWSLHQAAALGLADMSAANEVRRLAGQYYRSSAQLNGGELWLKDVMSPDENFTGNNDLYTNLLAQWCTGPTATAFRTPKDSVSLLTYDGDPVRAYKQAAAILSIYPLQNPEAEKQAKAMMARYADKVIKNGPAMSDSVNGVIWARMGDSEKAYSAWKSSWEPFTKQPLMLFSEKRNKPTTYFTTGAAGSLQTVLFGFLGFRLDSSQEPSAAWSRRLLGDSWLSIKPNLPKEWKSVKLKNFTVLGHPFTLTVTHRPNGPDAAEVIQGD